MKSHKKKAVLSVVLGILMLVSSYAIANEMGENFVAKKTERLKKELSLTDDQTAKVQNILEERRKLFEEQRAEMKKMHEEIASVLNEKQRAKYEKLKKRERKRTKHHDKSY